MSDFRFEEISPVLVTFLAGEGFDAGCSIALAGTAGSGRVYYRLGNGERTVVLQVSQKDDPDFGRFLRITQFYRMLRFPVPHVYCIDDVAHQVVLEDLGARRLYDVLNANRAEGLAGYGRTLDLLADLQTRCNALASECPDIHSRVFDREHLLWETSYYRTQYLEGHRGLQPDPSLQNVFDELASLVDLQPKAVLHRDFQSQNLMIAEDGGVHVIDYQGSRLGSVYYDAASLLLDPYVMLSDAEIEALLRHLHSKLPASPDFADFRRNFLHAGLQRVMQALGAYCFLSRVKGIASFAEHIRPGEERLRWLLRETGEDRWNAVLPGA